MNGERCPRCRSRLEEGDLRCAVCGRTAPSTVRPDRPTAVVDSVRCSGCGATVRYDVAERSPECAFCGGLTRVERPVDPPEQIDSVLPFTVDGGGARDAYRRWIGSLGPFRPGDLSSAARFDEIRPLWWTAWAFDAEATISWTADSDAGARRAEWAPHAGQTGMRFDDVVVPATRGLGGDEAAAMLASCRPDDAVTDLDLLETAGVTVERFDRPRSAARGAVLRALHRVAGERLRESGAIPGRRFRNVHVEALVERLSTRRLAVPAWIVAYRYRGRSYRTVICGRDAATVVGSAPWSVARIAVAVVGGAAILLALLRLLLTG